MNDPKKEQPKELTDETLEKVNGGRLLDSDGSQQTNEGEGKKRKNSFTVVYFGD